MRVTVIIPTYNRESTLKRALSSIYAQTLAPVEIIVVDDGSTDDTRQLIQKQFPDVVYLYQENKGVSAARNAAINRAQGNWIAFLDSDDEWFPGKLDEQSRTSVQHPECRLIHTEEIWIRNGKRVNAMKKHAKQGGWIYQNCLPLCVISPSSAIIRKDLFDDVGLFDESLPACEDYDLWLRICAREAVAFIATPQIKKHGGHDDQLSRKHWGMDRFRIKALEKMLQSDSLSCADETATREMIIYKAGILAQGAEKRGNTERAAHFRDIQTRYSSRPKETQATAQIQ